MSQMHPADSSAPAAVPSRWFSSEQPPCRRSIPVRQTAPEAFPEGAPGWLRRHGGRLR